MDHFGIKAVKRRGSLIIYSQYRYCGNLLDGRSIHDLLADFYNFFLFMRAPDAAEDSENKYVDTLAFQYEKDT